MLTQTGIERIGPMRIKGVRLDQDPRLIRQLYRHRRELDLLFLHSPVDLSSTYHGFSTFYTSNQGPVNLHIPISLLISPDPTAFIPLIIILIGYLDPLASLCPIFKQSDHSDHLTSLRHLNSLSNFYLFFTDPELIPVSSLANLTDDTRAFPSGDFGVLINL